jgi:hypothetical protein
MRELCVCVCECMYVCGVDAQGERGGAEEARAGY